MAARLETKNKQPVTMAEVAKHAGVSRQLASLAIRNIGYVNAEKRARVLQSAATLGYHRNILAAGLAGKKSNVIGMLTLDLHNQFYADVVQGAAEECARSGYHLLLAHSHDSRAISQAALDSLLSLRVGGVILASHIALTKSVVDKLQSVPTISLGDNSRAGTIFSVHANDKLGLYLATTHLHDQGHRKIAYLAGPNSRQNRDRKSGYLKAAKECGFAPNILDTEGTFESGMTAFEHLQNVKSDATGVVCFNDATALGFLNQMRLGKNPSKPSYAIVGYDNTVNASMPGIDLTSVDQHAKILGEIAAKRLIAHLAGDSADHSATILEPVLVIRKSSYPIS